MEKKEAIKQIIRDFHLRKPFDVISRDIVIPTDSGKIISLTGVRRSGKTSILYDTINRLTQEIDKTQILFINFEDERLELSGNELDLILQGYGELYPQHQLPECHLFFDEIQNVDGWERFVRRVYDSITTNIYITGSNSKLLGSEIATNLRGRTLRFEIFPLSFREYLDFNGIQVDLYSSKQLAFIRNAQSNFLKDGGFPELVFVEERYRIPLLQEYFHVLLYRDLIERYNIQNVTSLKYFLKRLIASTTKQLSIHKIYNELKSANIKTGKNNLYEYLYFAQSVYLSFVLYCYDSSLIARELGEKKIYSIDPGLCNAIEYKFSEDIGKALENAVFLELKRTGTEMFYYKDGTSECDFLLVDRGKVVEAVQVSFDISSPDTRKREIKGLIQSCRAFHLDKGTIITGDVSDEMVLDNVRIEMIPFYQFCCSSF